MGGWESGAGSDKTTITGISDAQMKDNSRACSTRGFAISAHALRDGFLL
jgi:hypothetical protein